MHTTLFPRQKNFAYLSRGHGVCVPWTVGLSRGHTMLSDDEVLRIAEKRRREARGDILELCDGVIRLVGSVGDKRVLDLRARVDELAAEAENDRLRWKLARFEKTPDEFGDCPVCAARRAAEMAKKRRYRRAIREKVR